MVPPAEVPLTERVATAGWRSRTSDQHSRQPRQQPLFLPISSTEGTVLLLIRWGCRGCLQRSDKLLRGFGKRQMQRSIAGLGPVPNEGVSKGGGLAVAHSCHRILNDNPCVNLYKPRIRP